MIRSIAPPRPSPPVWGSILAHLRALCACGLLALLLGGLPAFLGMPAGTRLDVSALASGAAWGYLCAGGHPLGRFWRWLLGALLPAASLGLTLLAVRHDPALQHLFAGMWGELRDLARAWAGGSLPAVPAGAGWPILCLGAWALSVAVFAALREDRPLPALLAAGGLLYGEWAFQERGIGRSLWIVAALGLLWLSLTAAAALADRPALDRPPAPLGLLGRALAAAGLGLLLLLLPSVRLPAPDLGSFDAWTGTHLPLVSRLLAGSRLGTGGGQAPAVGSALTPADPYSLRMEGFGQSDGTLGGPLQTSDAEALRLTVVSGSPPPTIYLQGLVLDTYTGTGWVESPARLHSAPPPLPPQAGLTPGAGAGFFGFRRGFTIEVQPTGVATSSLLTVPYARSVDVASLTWDRLGNAWMPAPLAPDAQYDVTAMAPRIPAAMQTSGTSFGFGGRFARFPGGGGFLRARPAADAPAAGDLQLPASLPAAVRQLAATWAAGASTPLGRALALQSHLLRIPYSMDAPAPPAGSDFVAYFLFSLHEGYCTYYASALAVMLRTLGIPARWVTGFAVPAPPRGQVTAVTDAEAHAWVEAFIAPYGWLLFDPTPPGPTLRPAATVPAGAPAAVASAPRPSLSGLLPDLAAVAGEAGGHAGGSLPGLLAALLAAVAAVAGLGARAWRRRAWRASDPVGSAARLWTRFRRSAGRAVRARGGNLTPAECARAVQQRWPAAAAACERAGEAYGRLCYGRPAARAAAALDLRAAWIAFQRAGPRAGLRGRVRRG